MTETVEVDGFVLQIDPEPGPWRVLVCGRKRRFPVFVSPEDYDWAVERGHWNVTHADRMFATGRGSYAYQAKGGGGSNTKMDWLHKLVLVRSGKVPPTPAYHIGDHRNGCSLDNRRGNLRWATHQMNARNIYGSVTRQLELPLLISV